MSERDAPKRPSHLAYQVNEGQDGKSYFNKVGAAFAHKDGQGFNVVLDSLPVDGRLTLRTPQERVEDTRKGRPQDRNQGRQRQDRSYER